MGSNKALRRTQKRNGSRNSRRSNDYQVTNVFSINNGEALPHSTAIPQPKELRPKNKEQETYINSIKNHNITVCNGKVGSGKTFIPSALAGIELSNKRIDRVVLIRPNEPLGKSLGMLPGDLKEKLKPWLAPIAEGLQFTMGKGFYDYCVENEKIEFVAVEHVRGRTFNDAYVIVDEAQNLSTDAIVAIVTRLGVNCKMVICGDVAQKDISSTSGLGLLNSIYEEYDYVPFNITELTECVRSPEASAFLDIFEEKGLL